MKPLKKQKHYLISNTSNDHKEWVDLPPPTLYYNISRFAPNVKKGRDIISENGKKLTPQEKYDKANTRFIGLKLNLKSDKDILDAIEGKPMQTEIKRLIRMGLRRE